MSYIPQKEWTDFVRKLSRINADAANLVSAWISENGLGNPKALISYAFNVATAYGTASGTLAALMYDSIAELEGIILPDAELADNPSIGDVAKAINGTLKTSSNAETISGAISRLVKMVGQDTLLKNAIRDRAEWAWIPSGDTCAFCITLASRGWQRANEGALKGGHAEHIHGNCDCTYMVRHRSDLNVRGYDPGKYLKMYEGAEGDTSKEKINSMRRMRYEQNKDVINAQKREAYAKRTEGEG